MSRRPMWDLPKALELVRKLEPLLAEAGWHVALAGSVLLTGESRKDLDLIVYPHRSPANGVMRKRTKALEAGGLELKHHRTVVQAHWRNLGNMDKKHVEVWWTSAGRRVDIFVLS